jgi:hypothetical protein
MKTYGEWRYSTTILHLDGGQSTSRRGRFTAGKKPPGRSGRCGEEKISYPAGNRTPADQPAAILAKLSRLLKVCI